MAAALLHLDDAFDGQAAFRAYVAGYGAQEVDLRALGPALRLWSRPDNLARLDQALDEALPRDEPMLVFMGSGDFHHVSVSLIARAVAMAPERPVTIVHFDNHPDWVRFSPGLHCGSWAAIAARMPGVAHVVTIGLCSEDMADDGRKGADLSVVHEGRLTPFPLRSADGGPRTIAGKLFPTIDSLGDAAFLKRLHDLIGHGDIYMTIDKDVLAADDTATNWDQGELRLERLLGWIAAVGDGRRLRGADVTGDGSRPVYGPHLLARLTKWIEARLDQPAWTPLTSTGHQRNSAGNIALFQSLSAMMRG